MEDLEFQKLEREIKQDEEKQNQSQELLREIAECQRLTVTRKVQQVRFYACARRMQCMYNNTITLPLHHSNISFWSYDRMDVNKWSGKKENQNLCLFAV